jgi:alcohol dehydrogenase
MRVVIYEVFNSPPQLKDVPDPSPETHGVVVQVRATGVCCSDWHGWVGHDADIHPPHVPGHELAGVVAMIESGKLKHEKLIGRAITLEQSIEALVNMDRFEVAGVTVVTECG